jgi:Transposase
LPKKHGISDATIYGWRKRFGELESTDARRLRQLEPESAKLKELVAERDLEIEVMKEINREKIGRPQAIGPSSARSVARELERDIKRLHEDVCELTLAMR